MGYWRLKQKVKEYERRDAKFYGNMINKLSKLEDDVSFLFPQTVCHFVARRLLWPSFSQLVHCCLLLPGGLRE